MPYGRPTLSQLNTQVLQDIQAAQLPGVDGLLQQSVLRVVGYAEAGLAYSHYGYQDYIALQSVPWTATGEAQIGWGALKRVFIKPATAAVLSVSFPGSSNTDLPANSAMATLFGTAFSTTADATVANGAVVVQALAAVAGSAGNLVAGSQISLTSPIGGITSTGTVLSIVTAGADAETTDAYRTRMLSVYANPPQGGAAGDYEEWAEAVAGVSRAWCNPNGAGVGTVVVYIMLDQAEAAYGGFPQGTNGVATGDPRAAAATGDQLTVANAILPLQPVTALVYLAAPIALAVPVTIFSALALPSTVQAAVQTALTDMFLRLGSPLGVSLYPSDFEDAIASVAGVGQFSLTLPAGPVPLPIGQLPVLGAINFSSAGGTTTVQGTATWDGFTWDDGTVWL